MFLLSREEFYVHNSLLLRPITLQEPKARIDRIRQNSEEKHMYALNQLIIYEGNMVMCTSEIQVSISTKTRTGKKTCACALQTLTLNLAESENNLNIRQGIMKRHARMFMKRSWELARLN